jgi:Xaa-Pro aminopeptidase
MEMRNLDALLIYSQKRSHVRYISGYSPNYHTNAALVLLPLRRDPMMWVKFAFDVPRAKNTSWIADIRPSFDEDTNALVSDCAKAVRQLRLDQGRLGIVASDLAIDEMSISLDNAIRSELPKADLQPASDLLNAVRLIKSPAEIRSIRSATQVAESVVEALRRSIRPGGTDLDAVTSAERVARAAGARCDIIISTDASRLAFPPLRSKFHRKSVVTCEITIELDGYWVQICRTLSVGRASAVQKEIFAASRQAYEASVAAANAGKTICSVWQAIMQSLSGNGLDKAVQYGAGHGIGTDLPELYAVTEHCDSEIRPNMILVLHPGVWAANRGAGWTGGPIVVGDNRARALDMPQREMIEI